MDLRCRPLVFWSLSVSSKRGRARVQIPGKCMGHSDIGHDDERVRDVRVRTFALTSLNVSTNNGIARSPCPVRSVGNPQAVSRVQSRLGICSDNWRCNCDAALQEGDSPRVFADSDIRFANHLREFGLPCRGARPLRPFSFSAARSSSSRSVVLRVNSSPPNRI